MKRWFVHSIHHYKAKNEKIKEVHCLIDTLNRSLLIGENPLFNLTKYIADKCEKLDKKYPRTRPLFVRRYTSSISIYSGDPEKAQIESGHIAISFSVTPIAQTMEFIDGEAFIKREGGES